VERLPRGRPHLAGATTIVAGAASARADEETERHRMALNVCPAARVAAPVEIVWDLLADPARWDTWIDGRVQRIAPAGPAVPGQIISVTAPGLGRRWPVLFRVEVVNPPAHQLGMQVTLPLGMRLQEHVSCTPLDPASCRVQYG
jgi:hypothetical protein